jgi:hypothetical protein
MAQGTMERRQTAPIATRGIVMNIISWILLAVVVCTLVARFAMKLSMKTRRRKLGLDDLFIGLAAVGPKTQQYPDHGINNHRSSASDRQWLSRSNR